MGSTATALVGGDVTRLLVEIQVVFLQGRDLLPQGRNSAVLLLQFRLELRALGFEAVALGLHHGQDAGAAPHGVRGAQRVERLRPATTESAVGRALWVEA